MDRSSAWSNFYMTIILLHFGRRWCFFYTRDFSKRREARVISRLASHKKILSWLFLPSNLARKGNLMTHYELQTQYMTLIVEVTLQRSVFDLLKAG